MIILRACRPPRRGPGWPSPRPAAAPRPPHGHTFRKVVSSPTHALTSICVCIYIYIYIYIYHTAGRLRRRRVGPRRVYRAPYAIDRYQSVVDALDVYPFRSWGSRGSCGSQGTCCSRSSVNILLIRSRFSLVCHVRVLRQEMLCARRLGAVCPQAGVGVVDTSFFCALEYTFVDFLFTHRCLRILWHGSLFHQFSYVPPNGVIPFSPGVSYSGA